MKIAKKICSFLLVLTLLCAMASTALAVTITINDTGAATGNSYAAYKLLNATNATDADGNGTDKFAYTLNEKYKVILQEVTGKTTEAEIIAYIGTLETDDAIRAFANDVYEKVKNLKADYTTTSDQFEDVAQGYYLIAETDAQEHPDAVSLVMLDTAGVDNITVETKESVPTVEKKVKDTDDSTGETTGWQDSADYDFGDEIPYQITGTVSEEYANYITYYYLFTDTMVHLTYNGDAKVKLVNKTSGDQTSETDITSKFIINWDKDKKVLTLTCADLKKVEGVAAGSKIVVEYTATLDADAVIGEEGNPNKVTLTYSRDPYSEDGGKPTNTTPPDTNIVFTFEGVVNKVDQDKKPLKGAGFTLYKFVKAGEAEGEWKAVGEERKGDAMTEFEFKGLDAGQYKIVETTVPAGYNKADDIEFTIVAEHEEKADQPKLTSLVVKDKGGKTISGENLTFTANKTAGTVSTDVVNKTGPELPSTGGIGTTIFYIVGGILFVGAGVVLVARKRMSNAEND